MAAIERYEANHDIQRRLSKLKVQRTVSVRGRISSPIVCHQHSVCAMDAQQHSGLGTTRNSLQLQSKSDMRHTRFDE